MIPIGPKVDIGLRAEQAQSRIASIEEEYAERPFQRLIQLEYVRQVLAKAMAYTETEVLADMERIKKDRGNTYDRYMVNSDGAVFESGLKEDAFHYEEHGPYRKAATEMMKLKKGLRDATRGRAEGPTVAFRPRRYVKVYITGNLKGDGAKEKDLA